MNLGLTRDQAGWLAGNGGKSAGADALHRFLWAAAALAFRPPLRTATSRLVDIYLPVAGLSVNALVIIGLGGVVGLLSGMVGVGGGFLTTPILIFYGFPPAVGVASSTKHIMWMLVCGFVA